MQYGITKENHEEFISDFEYKWLRHINPKYRKWMEDKITVKYICSDYNECFPEYYYHIICKNGNNKVISMMDLPEGYTNSFEDIFKLVEEKGVLALMAAEQMKVDGCVPISAPMAVKNRFLHLAGPASLFIKRISWGDPGNRASLVDPAYDFGYTGFPTAKGADLNRLIRLARQNLFNLTCPILCVQSDADETIWKGSADCILEGVGSEVRQKLWLSGMPHVCTLSKELPAIVAAVDAFMDRVEAEKEG